jgi:pimeloyl-ACP methyl ester carboxylesterase
MPAFFVHGVPDTATMWDGIREHLSRTDVVAPNLPGFDAPIPAGFGATKDEYAAWLIGAVEAVGEPVDIVGHDWGSLLVQRVVSLRPDLVRTWAAGAASVDKTYVWHDMAVMWQTPEVGEQVMEAMTPEALAMTLGEQVGEARAAEMARHVDETMKTSILRLYRSATSHEDWHDDVDRVLPTRPGVVFWGAQDPFVTRDYGERLAQRTHARLVMFEDAGHWWPVQKPAEVARELEELWAASG